ncbi:hypothetical protein [Leptolyngbya sp. O-77]|uniref:hypothetical protein n=1 Tax=Leptolyngbya sp. O-77 TaxID=1080068 RepID=UPI0015601798|nr:hypothetical protein [Leptolyngbya sp. O-77]
MKKLILTEIKCDGLADGEIKKLVPRFRRRPVGNPVDVTKTWKRWGDPEEIPDPQPFREMPDEFNGKIYLRSPENQPLFESSEDISANDSGAGQTSFVPVNPSTASAGIVPKLRYVIQ